MPIWLYVILASVGVALVVTGAIFARWQDRKRAEEPVFIDVEEASMSTLRLNPYEGQLLINAVLSVRPEDEEKAAAYAELYNKLSEAFSYEEEGQDD